MAIYYLSFGSSWRNLTSPLTYWHRGTAFQLDNMKKYPETQVPHCELGTDMVILTMAARIMQTLISLVRNRLQKRAWYWKMVSGGWMSRAFQAVLGTCWRVINILLALEMTRVYFNNMSRYKLLCHRQTMNTIIIKNDCEYQSASVKVIVPEDEELPSILNMRKFREESYMDVEQLASTVCNMDKMVSSEMPLSSCTNPFILSMFCIPSEDGEPLLPSEESDVEGGDEQLEKDTSLEDMSVDSGMQEVWAPKSNEEESDWSDEDDWDEDNNTDFNKEDEDLWASFCQSDDPYNPLSFAMPIASSKQQSVQGKEVSIESLETRKVSGSPDRAKCSATLKVACGTVDDEQKCTAKSPCKKPVLSSFKSSHKCFPKKDELEVSQDSDEQEKKHIKRVRFSSKVAVHPIVVWDYAHRMARKGPWEEYARDRSRFQRRIADTEAAIGYCLEPCHRERIWAGPQSKKN
ncbi:uncharacterized protein LOC142107259 [Mixophyes fleayi]|uniref:uncharacterized protein LOC142107259 n=1 Tax=Mixophyes fleayi TaxID=3061075 RepID=UPI003F4D76ED